MSNNYATIIMWGELHACMYARLKEAKACFYTTLGYCTAFITMTTTSAGYSVTAYKCSAVSYNHHQHCSVHAGT